VRRVVLPTGLTLCYQHVMAKSTLTDNTKSQKKMGRPVTTGKGELVGVRILPDLLAALDKQVEESGAESRAEAIREIISNYLRRKGFM